MIKTYVLYHGHCPDGFGAAFAAWCALGDAPQYIPVDYGEPMPEIESGARVFIVDFSYPENSRAREELCALDERSAELVVIDHHKTAQAALKGLPFAIFDMASSGAVLTWEYFAARPELIEEGAYGVWGGPPQILEYVQDRDLWKWELPHSREYNAGLSLVPREFDRWLGIAVPESDRYKELIHQGGIVLKRDAQLVSAICDLVQMRALYVGDGRRSFPIACVNTPILQSDCCHELLQRHPQDMAVAAYFEKQGKRVWSLRSRPDYDCSWIAKANGGGGHAQACGFEEPI